MKVNIETQYDKIGQSYLDGQKKFFSKREDQAIKFITNSLPNLKNKTILDFGCGNGNDMVRYEKLGANIVYGIDTSKFMVLEAKKKVSKPENIFLADIQKTNFNDNFFDIVVGRFSLHYLNNFNNVYKEVARILKKGGSFIFIVHHPLKDLMMQKNKKYGEKEIIKVELYDNKTPVHFPSHTLKEYFSKDFFKYFYLDNFEEEKSPEEYLDEFKVPGFIGIKSIKR